MATPGPSSTAYDFRPGTQFKQYQLLEQIGAGGQGIVWSAYDQGQQRVVAVKFSEVPEQADGYDDMRHRESIRLVELRHPYILPLYEVGLAGRLRFLVSLYAAGGSLSDKIAKGPLDIRETLRYASEIAEALEYLHTEGVIHRDLKTSNVLTDLSQNAFLADFGIARFTSDSTQAVHTGRGTPMYAPPEQHKMTAISPQSDIYSFGVMLYELFAGHLPWNGEAPLGIKQLYSNEELPDPRAVDASLPQELATVLRRMTAIQAADRPASAREAFQMLLGVFEVQPVPVNRTVREEAEITRADAQELLRRNLERWESSTGGSASLSLTKFAIVDAYLRQLTPAGGTPERIKRFMLHHALTFGYNDRFWWSQVPGLEEKMAIAGRILGRGNEKSDARIVGYLDQERDLRVLQGRVPEPVLLSLLRLAGSRVDPVLRRQALVVLRKSTAAARKWRPAAFDEQHDQALAELALENSPGGNEAARLIGHLRSESAAQAVVRTAGPERRMAALLNIQQVSGDLPRCLPAATRRRSTVDWILHRLFEHPGSILAAYLAIFLGIFIGTGLQVFLSYQNFTLYNTPRIIGSLERGALMGVALGFGLLATRLIVERFHGHRVAPRLLLATAFGAAILNVGIFSYHVLLLNNPPRGILLSLACLLIALGYAIGALKRSILWRMLASGPALLIAIAGSWWIHLQTMGAATSLSPFFYYGYQWSWWQTLLIILLLAIPMTTIGNLVSLAPSAGE